MKRDHDDEALMDREIERRIEAMTVDYLDCEILRELSVDTQIKILSAIKSGDQCEAGEILSRAVRDHFNSITNASDLVQRAREDDEFQSAEQRREYRQDRADALRGRL